MECWFTLKRVRDMTRTYSQTHHTDKYSQHSVTTWPVWLNGWVFVYDLSGCGFQCSCSHLNFTICACFEQGVPWHSGNHEVWIHPETLTWHDKNKESIKILIETHVKLLHNITLKNVLILITCVTIDGVQFYHKYF